MKNFGVWLTKYLLEIFGFFFSEFLLVRVLAPGLLTAHNTIDLLLAVLCYLMAVLILVWGVIFLHDSYVRQFSTKKEKDPQP